jgi:hypothetical protein
LFNDDIHNLYHSQNIKALKTRALPQKGSVARMEICKNKYSISGRKPEGKRKFELPKGSTPGLKFKFQRNIIGSEALS